MKKIQSVTALSHLISRRITSLPPQRSLSSLPDYTSNYTSYTSLNANRDPSQMHVLVEGRTNSRASVLNRTSVLNAVNTPMAARLNKLYESWEENADIGFVQMKSRGRAFSAGSDVVTLSRLIEQGKLEECKEFFGTLYKFIYTLGTYLKPHVAIMDGISMGAGAGIALPGMFRVATNRTIFSTPETQIGFHPDAGASFYLSRLPGYLGEYLALTGQQLNGAEMIACGLATHYCMNKRIAMIEERLGTLITDVPSVVESSLAIYGDLIYPDESSVLHRIETIDKCFGQDTVEEVIDALENEAADSYDDWCTSTLKQLKEASPLSLKVTLRSIREGRFQQLDQCLSREYRVSVRAVSKQVSNDFCEGVRARLVDKDYAPKWDPPRLEDVSKEMVDFHFAPFSEVEPELELPTALREPYF